MSVSAWWWAIVCIPLCGLGYRIRGGLWHERFPRPGQVSRLVWGGIAGTTGFAAGAIWWAALLLIPAFWLGATLPLFHAMDLGANEGTFWGDFGLLTLRGILGVAAATAVLFGADTLHWWALVIAGSLMGACYAAGRAMRVGVPGFGQGGLFSETGEFLTGAAIGLGLFVALAT